MHSQFTFFKAGQGAFYGGHIWNYSNNSCFTVVYDCGTSCFVKGNNQSLNSEIDLFKKGYSYRHNSLKDDTIDLLFISHLDYDHVSGIKRLINEFNVKRIILPYVDPINRSYFLASFDNDIEDNGLTLDDFSSFLQEPVSFIRNQEGSKEIEVSFVKGGRVNSENVDFTPGKSEGIFESEKAVNDKIELSGLGDVNVYENNLQIQLYKYWEFTIYVQEIEEKKLDALIDGIKSILNIDKERSLSIEDLKGLFKEDANRRALRKCYKENVDDINSHGLVLLHGPINVERLYSNYCINDCIGFCDYCPHFYEEQYQPKALYTLLLGDTSLNKDNNPLVFPKQFLDKLPYVNVVQIPHHGSIKNWDKQEYEKLKLGTSNCWGRKVIAVCNYGVGNTYKHPAQEVINEVEGTLVLNNQFTRFTTCYDFKHIK